MNSLSFEENEWKFLSKVIGKDMICLDIGANQGFYTVFLSRKVGRNGKVFAFEPLPGEFRKLKQNLRINRCSNIVMERMAIGACDGIADMFVCLDGHGSRSSMRTPPEEVTARTQVEKVPITTVDRYVQRNKIKRIDFIKIDVEGAERDVLESSREVFSQLRPLVMIEMADVTTHQFGYRAVENYHFLERHGFKLFEFSRSGNLKPARPKDQYRENLIALPNEKLHMISDFMEKN